MTDEMQDDEVQDEVQPAATPADSVLLVARAFTPDYADDFEYAVLSLTEAACLELLQQFGLARMCKSSSGQFYRIEYFNYDVLYYGDKLLNTLPESFQDLDHDYWRMAPEDWEPDEVLDPGRAEGETIKISDTDAIYSCSMKHADSSPDVDTPRLTMEMVSEVLGELHRRRKPGPRLLTRERHVELTDDNG